MLDKSISLTFHCQSDKKSSLLLGLCELHCRLQVPSCSKCTCAHQVLLGVIGYVNAVQFISSVPCNSGFSSVHLSTTNAFASYCDSPFQNGVMKRFYELGGMVDVEG